MPYRVESDPNGPSVITFDSVMDFAALASDGPSIPRYVRSRLENNPKFTGVQTIADAQRLAARGLRAEGIETLDIAKDVIKELQQDRILPEFQSVYDVQGFDVDIDRYLTGEPECMIDYPLDEPLATGPVVTLVLGMNYSAIVTKDAILAQGRLAMALALALDACGYSLEIWSEIHTGCGLPRERKNYPHAIKVKVKVLEAGTSLDPSALAYGLCHPSMLRVFGFAAMHLAPDEHQSECGVGNGYGVPRPIDPSDWPDNAIILNPRSGQATSDDLRTDLLNYLTELGILKGDE